MLMFLDSFVNQNIQVKFKNFPEALTGPMTGIFKPEDWYTVKLISSESMGIWVENPCYKRTMVQDEDGRDIPLEEQKEENCTTNLLIRWEYIHSVITLPNEHTKGIDKETMLIGFHS